MIGILRRLTPKFLLSCYHFLWALFGAVWYRFPAQGMIAIGVTGTNGKSTTVDMISRIFREAGIPVASLSSIRFQIKGREWKNTMKMTMPGRTIIQRFLRQAKDAGCTHVVLEVTSEGILQHRHRFIPFHTAVFTNLSPEHIERHGSFENYKKTKGKLFAAAKEVHVINADEEHAGYFLSIPAQEKVLYGMKEAKTPPLRSGGVFAQNVLESKEGTRFLVEDTEFRLNLLGRFNISNALAAVAVARAHDISLEICKKALAKMQGVPGRMEEVISSPFRVVVDYAFTPAALEKVYKTFKPEARSAKSEMPISSSILEEVGTHSQSQPPKLICILGAAGGGRDSWKRPVLGKIAEQNCDVVFVTNEDPYEEDPMKIMREVAHGAQGKAEIVPDRREAIQKGLTLASPGDTVVITGKGSEDSIAVRGGKKIPWDDREVVRQEWTKLRNRGKL